MTDAFYSAPSHMAGGYIVYRGQRRQRGAGTFGSIRSIMAPMRRPTMRGIRTAGRTTMRGMRRAGQSTRKGMRSVGKTVLKGVKRTGRTAVKGAKSLAKNKTFRNIAKLAATKGAEVLTSVAVDALQGRNVGESFKDRGREVALRSLGAAETSSPRSSTPLSKRKQKRVINQEIKRLRKLKQNKRPAADDIHFVAPPKKRRRPRGLSRAALNRRQLF